MRRATSGGRTQRANASEGSGPGSQTDAGQGSCAHASAWEYVGASQSGNKITHHYRCPDCKATDTVTERV